MKTNFQTISNEQQTTIMAGSNEYERTCHTCGGSKLEHTGDKDQWGYDLYRCLTCGNLNEFWNG